MLETAGQGDTGSAGENRAGAREIAEDRGPHRFAGLEWVVFERASALEEDVRRQGEPPGALLSPLSMGEVFPLGGVERMASSFGVVEDKLREADFFLSKLRESERLSFEEDCYFSAFVTAARSVTDAMRASLEGLPGFKAWFDEALKRLKTDPLVPFFVEIRNEVVHEGINPLNRVSLEHLRADLSRQVRGDRGHVLVLPDAGRRDSTVLVNAVDACEQFFTSVVGVVYECYSSFKTVVDARWYFTEANFSSMGKTLEDAVVELGFPPTWAACAPTGPEAWRALRSQQPPCLINDVFDAFLGKCIPDPDE
jgi:hypothetical protein